MKTLLCCFLLFFLRQGRAQKVDYTNYKIVASEEGLDLSKFVQQASDLIKWFEPVTEDRSSILLDPSSAEALLPLLRAANVPYRIVTENLQKDIENEVSPSKDWFKAYHRYEELLKWLEDVTRKHSKYCSLHDIGHSHEGRLVRVLKIQGKKNHCEHKPAIWIDSGIHAREWISHTTSTFIIDRLLQEYETSSQVRELRDTYDWYFLVTMNPDGYVHSWEKDRVWRKSRKPVNNSPCIGTDTNRNFDHMWNQIGSSNNPCAQTFAGPHAFSDPEAKAVADFIMAKKGHWDVYLTIHSYGHLLMSPWGYTKDLPPKFKDMEEVGNASVKAVYEVHGKKYKFGAAARILYPTSGSSDDWAYGIAGIPYSYCFELRNDNSFVLPPSEIIPTGEEIWAGVKALVKTVKAITPPQCKK